MSAVPQDAGEFDEVLAQAIEALESEGESAVARICAEHEGHAKRILERLAQLADRGLLQPLGAAPPESIGPYRIVERLGVGGMGIVYKAEQREPVRRVVALKVIKPGFARREVLVRFELEQRALAAMNHGNIARILDGGVTDSGQPYFAMELVDGVPITEYCDRHNLSLDERVELFRGVCAGVQHAHQKGVMHRDLKPANILVAREGDRAVPKIVDFGVAKAIDRELTTQTLLSEHDFLVGTPDYMAPEQVLGDPDAIDSRADVYTLGVVLFELLTGELPNSPETLGQAGRRDWLEVRRRLHENEPPRPSTRVGGTDKGRAELARRRRTTAQMLRKQLRGDLDWIALKAMAKGVDRRYDSAAELGADLGRYLAGEPVLAGPPSAAYRLGKLARRQRGSLAAAAVVALSLLLGAIVFWVGKERALEQERLVRERAAVLELQRNQLALERAEFELLSNVLGIDSALASERELYPAWPARAGALRAWLAEHEDRMRNVLPELRRVVGDLERRALQPTAEERLAARRIHPRFEEFERLSIGVTSLREASRARQSGEALALPELSRTDLQLGAPDLVELARSRVAPLEQGRTVYGEEALGAAYARAALEKTREGQPQRSRTLATLAWAWCAVGRDAEALECMHRAVDEAPADEVANLRDETSRLRAAVDEAEPRLRLAEASLERLNEEISARREWRFADKSERFLHDTLAGAMQQLERIDAELRPGVEQRLHWAEQLAMLTRHDNARFTWRMAREAILAADGVSASADYGLFPIDLAPQLGLVPLGMNPVTKLWEFYHLASAFDPGTDSDPAELPIPVLLEDGSLEPVDDMGMVFVLLPGGSFSMGSQSRDRGAPNYDPWAQPYESVHTETLQPFFIARHELTQGQWLRLDGSNPSAFPPPEQDGQPITFEHPVENVSWNECQELLTRQGLELPTLVQWEYACRAGTDTPFSSGRDVASLEDFANVMDASGRRHDLESQPAPWDDGFYLHSPVGSFLPNDFGLYDLHGNVWEWCRNFATPDRQERFNRGGSYQHTPTEARSGRPGYRQPPDFRTPEVGARAVRAVLD